jgi:hypothetical protein
LPCTKEATIFCYYIAVSTILILIIATLAFRPSTPTLEPSVSSCLSCLIPPQQPIPIQQQYDNHQPASIPHSPLAPCITSEASPPASLFQPRTKRALCMNPGIVLTRAQGRRPSNNIGLAISLTDRFVSLFFRSSTTQSPLPTRLLVASTTLCALCFLLRLWFCRLVPARCP